MDTAIPWYKSRTILVLLAGILIALMNKFGVLPEGMTQDSLVELLLWIVPMILALISRASATKQVVGTAKTAADINSTSN